MKTEEPGPDHPLDRLQKIYDSLPKLDCKKLCFDTCGPINWSEIENHAIKQHLGGVLLKMTNPPDCPYLTPEKTCAIYAVRPIICRLWGLVDDPRMRCPHGCVPERYLTNAEAKLLMAEIEEIEPLRLFGEKIEV